MTAFDSTLLRVSLLMAMAAAGLVLVHPARAQAQAQTVTSAPSTGPAQAGATALPSAAAPISAVVYRCPGNPVLYTDQLSAREAQERGCRTIDGAPITIVPSARPRPTAPVATAGVSPVTAPAAVASPGNRIDPAEQRARDTDARRILESELRTEEQRLAGLLRDFNNGEPERRGDERNYQKYLDRVAEMRSAIARKESDVAAIRRELAKLPPTGN